MNKYVIRFITVIVCAISFSNTQLHAGNKFQLQTLNAQMQANAMAKAFITQDYQTFAKYTYHTLLTAMGGENQMAITLRQTVNDMKLKGMSFYSIVVDSPSKMFKSHNELQCTLQQHTTVKMGDGRVVATSTLIALSEDGGKHWYFIDTSNKDEATIRKIMPNLSKAIIIPSQQKPVFYNN